jgi:hypothetical protein
VTPPPYDVLVTDGVLLSFDGRVLEVFGVSGADRIHIWQQPRLEFDNGRHPRMRLVTGQGVRHLFRYDPHRLDALRALADRLAESLSERPEP